VTHWKKKGSNREGNQAQESRRAGLLPVGRIRRQKNLRDKLNTF